MKGLVIARLVTHVLVLIGIVAFFASVPGMLLGVLSGLLRVDLIVKACGVNVTGCLALAGFWTVIVVAILALVLDAQMLRRNEGVEARLWRSLALELLLPAGWYATLSSMGNSDVVGPMWFLLPGPPILVSAAASAVVAWLLVKDNLRAVVGAARLWIGRAIAVVLTLMAGALGYLFANLVLGEL